MLGSIMLDVVIGIVFVLLSTVCSAIREGIEARLKTRAAYLEHGIREYLHDRQGAGVASAFFNHGKNESEDRSVVGAGMAANYLKSDGDMAA